jgi:hypothetical protein
MIVCVSSFYGAWASQRADARRGGVTMKYVASWRWLSRGDLRSGAAVLRGIAAAVGGDVAGPGVVVSSGTACGATWQALARPVCCGTVRPVGGGRGVAGRCRDVRRGLRGDVAKVGGGGVCRVLMPTWQQRWLRNERFVSCGLVKQGDGLTE